MINVTVKFPVSESEWIALCAIQAHQTKSEPFAMLTQAIDAGLKRGFASNDITWVEEDDLLPELSAKEQELLDARLLATHEEGQTSILDAFESENVGNLKPNFSEKIVEYYTQNPGNTIKQGANDLAKKFANHYESTEIGYKKLHALIHVLASSRKQRRLIKVRNHDHVGMFPSHQ